MKTQLTNGLLGIVIGVILMLFLMPKSENVDDILKAKDKAHKQRIDSLNAVIVKYQLQQDVLLKEISYLKIQKSQASKETQQYKNLYERLKNRPPERLSNTEIDSVLSALYH
jgi:hypothetical protein